jgi:hypothetical protein
MILFAAPSTEDILTALAVIVTVAFLITFGITRGLAPLLQNARGKWPQLRDDLAALDSRWLKAGTLAISGTIGAGIVSGVLTAMGSPTRLIAWAFCWFGGVALARFVAGPRTAGALSGFAMGAFALYCYSRGTQYSVDVGTDVFSKVVIFFALAFGLGYGISLFTGGIHRLVRWVWQRGG